MMPDTLSEYLTHPEVADTALTLVDAHGRESHLDVAAMYARACTALNELHKAGLSKGDCVVLYVNRNDVFLAYFWGCLLAGIVPAPLSAARSEASRNKLLNVLHRLEQPPVIADDDTRDHVSQWLEQKQLRDTTVITGSSCADASTATIGKTERILPHDTAYIQFSSGSTGDPKGIVLTHDNLLANIRAICRTIHAGDSDRTVSWLPLTHDMGLIGFHLCPLVWGITHTIISPQLFFRSPAHWLRIVSQTRATITAAPTFGLKHVLKHTAKKGLPSDVDLSSVRILFNGAEPVSPSICREFLKTMAPLGLSERVMFPVYGLTEASRAVSFPVPGTPLKVIQVDRRYLADGDRLRFAGDGDSPAAAFICVGKPVPDCGVRVVDSAGRPCPDTVVGHVEISGRNVSRGYIVRKGVIEERGPWQSTGDIGVMVDGELYIIGRSKEIYIQNGTKHHLADLDTACGKALGMVDTNLACAVVQDQDEHGPDKLVAFIEGKQEVEEIDAVKTILRRTVYTEFSVMLHDVVQVTRLPRTTSGKVQRNKLGQLYRAESVEAS